MNVIVTKLDAAKKERNNNQQRILERLRAY